MRAFRPLIASVGVGLALAAAAAGPVDGARYQCRTTGTLRAAPCGPALTPQRADACCPAREREEAAPEHCCRSLHTEPTLLASPVSLDAGTMAVATESSFRVALPTASHELPKHPVPPPRGDPRSHILLCRFLC